MRPVIAAMVFQGVLFIVLRLEITDWRWWAVTGAHLGGVAIAMWPRWRVKS